MCNQTNNSSSSSNMGVEYVSDLGTALPLIRGESLENFRETPEQTRVTDLVFRSVRIYNLCKADKEHLASYLFEQERYRSYIDISIVTQLLIQLLTWEEKAAYGDDIDSMNKALYTALQDERVIIRGVLVLHPEMMNVL